MDKFDREKFAEALAYVEEYAMFTCVDTGYQTLTFTMGPGHHELSSEGRIVQLSGQERVTDAQFYKDINRARYNLALRRNPENPERLDNMKWMFE